MRDPITDAAQDPSCLLCLTPDRGGSWWSRLRPAMPRDFSEGYQWDMLQAAMYSSLPWTSDYHFTFDFTVADDFENGSYWIMYQSNGRIVFSLDKDARGCRFTLGSFAFSGGVYVLTPFLPSLAGRHEVSLAVEGATLRVTVDGTVYEQSGERVESSAYNRVVTTSAPVTLHAVSLTDDSTGTAVWQAAYSDLYDTSNPWPSPVPENFAENAKAFYDCQAVVREELDPTHDYSFLIDFKLDEAKMSGSVFYATPSAAPFALLLQSNNQIDFFTNLLKPNGDSDSFTSIYAYYQSDVKLQGRHQIECKIEANMLSSYLDGVLVAQKTSNLERTGTAAVGLPNCNSGYVYKIQITDLTDNHVVWSYPSEAERVRLITKTNVRTDRGAFEAANTSLGWSIKTAVPAGITGTVLARINGECIVNPAQWNRTTATFTGLATDRVNWLLAYNRVLSSAEIAALTPKRQPLSWAGISDIVRRGRAQRYFAVGDVLTVATPRWTIEYEVTGFDQVEPADAALTHSMTLLPVRLVTNLQFDAPEPGNPDASRAQYGCNRWDWSAIRQWMNSAAAPGEWWTAQHEYDAAPAYAATLAGFMADLPADFLSAVAPARLVTALPNADGGGSVETVDRFWAPSRTEIFGDTNEDGIVEGVQMTKYIDATDADRIKYNAAGTATIWWLRTHMYYARVSVLSVDASGSLNNISAISTWGIVPACIIA